MSHDMTNLTPFNRHEATSGSVQGDRFAACSDLEGASVRCTSGNLWVTLENDVMDHILRAGQSLAVAVPGKVIIGGKGSYQLEPSARMPLAS